MSVVSGKKTYILHARCALSYYPEWRALVKINKDADADPASTTLPARTFKRPEDGNEEAQKHRREWRALSIRKYEGEYAELNVAFDEYICESTSARSRRATHS